MGSETRERMVQTAARLVMSQGFHGTSLAEILAASQAPRGSLYFHFPGGKEELILAGAQHAIAQASKNLRHAFAQTADASEGIRLFFDGLVEMELDSHYRIGCPVNALTSDTPAHTSPLSDVCREGIREWEQIYRDAFVADGIAPTRAAELATFVLAAEEGAILMARARRETAPLESVRDQLATMIRNEPRSPA